MENIFQPAVAFAIGITLAWLSGIRVYLTVFGIGLASLMGWMTLPAHLQVVQSPLVLGVSGALCLVEFFTDKMPGVDSIWDLISTVVRIPAGAFLGGMALPDAAGDATIAGMLLGGGVALGSHVLKSSTRALINGSPEPVSNWVASLTEDTLALVTLMLVVTHPFWALGLLVLATLGFVWALRLLLRLLRRVKLRMAIGIH
ncbi:MAG: DUF4126 domain-containing protein [Pseudomonadota bacterium]|nr:DUF4126 domain-containing protein [Pseudomonadota bacterium]